jgi:hypothetical protein
LKQSTLLLVVIGFSVIVGCAVTSDIRDNGSISSADREVASRIADLTKERCTHYRYDTGSDRKLSGDMKFSQAIVVKRIYRSSVGWVKAEVVANSIWDNIYYSEKNGNLVCGEKNWQKLSGVSAVSFAEVGKPEGPSAVAMATAAPATRQATASGASETRPLALRWEGYANLISGTASLLDGGRKGSISAVLPGGEGKCSGLYEFVSSTTGQWAVSCTNNLSATGTFEAFGRGNGSTGKGKDTKGNLVEFSIGASP